MAGSASGLSISLIGFTLEETDRRSLRVFNCKVCKQPATRYQAPGTRHPLPATRHPWKSAAEFVLLSRTDSLLNLWPLCIVVSTKVASVHDISAVNLIVGCCLFACSMNFLGTSLLVCQRKIMSSMHVTFPSQWFVSAFV